MDLEAKSVVCLYLCSPISVVSLTYVCFNFEKSNPNDERKKVKVHAPNSSLLYRKTSWCTSLHVQYVFYSNDIELTKDNHKIKLFILYYMYTKHNGYMIDFKCVRRIFLNDLWIKHSVKNLFFNFYLCIFTIRVLSLIYLNDKKLISPATL